MPMLDKNDSYAWIQTFIDYLKQIIDMILKLFNGMSASGSTEQAE